MNLIIFPGDPLGEHKLWSAMLVARFLQSAVTISRDVIVAHYYFLIYNLVISNQGQDHKTKFQPILISHVVDQPVRYELACDTSRNTAHPWGFLTFQERSAENIKL